ncbi:hypothetical protein [Natronobacterium gregoryi]|uniref:Uncharacterized protein n=2 Tax=Natronobacterium gregoryi TaxID=44930 RepID=L0AKP0_NATGS|nr:hypothetical protein [Natronobacterium gregoryi]AFZ74468.1 hypothetical protein Natgr_3345 [Natronobacterium gregoryi SP2]SFJ45932.1 hypothetical protein SAMN05443661_13119 [Natronobacterium gregoryi]
MSRPNRPPMQIGCPNCDTTVDATIPPGRGIGGDEPDRLQGTETNCRNCGHEFELYYY